MHTRRLKWVKKEVDRIIVPSRSTMSDLVDLGFSENKIRVISEAVDPEFSKVSQKEVAEVLKSYHISGKYLLTVGVGGRKNTTRSGIGAGTTIHTCGYWTLELVRNYSKQSPYCSKQSLWGVGWNMALWIVRAYQPCTQKAPKIRLVKRYIV